jgi:hypothetical protein
LSKPEKAEKPELTQQARAYVLKGKIMANVDLSDVDPLRHAEILRRVEVIEAYLAIARPTPIETASHASAIGISIPSFYRLAKVWRLHRNPAILPGAGSRGSKKNRPTGVSSRAREIVTKVIAEVGCSASQTLIHHMVVSRCMAIEIAPPSRGATWTYVMDARSGGLHEVGVRERLVTGRCWAQLPTNVGGVITLPEIALTIALPDRLILGFDISLDTTIPANAARSLAQALDQMSGWRPVKPREIEIEMDAGDMAVASDLILDRLGRAADQPASTTSPIIITALGREVGGLRIIHRLRSASATRLLGSRMNTAVSPDNAAAAISAAVDRHNLRIRSKKTSR